MRSMTFLIHHYTVHIPRWGKFTTGGVITDRRKLLSLVLQQSTHAITGIPNCLNYCIISKIYRYGHGPQVLHPWSRLPKLLYNI